MNERAPGGQPSDNEKSPLTIPLATELRWKFNRAREEQFSLELQGKGSEQGRIATEFVNNELVFLRTASGGDLVLMRELDDEGKEPSYPEVAFWVVKPEVGISGEAEISAFVVLHGQPYEFQHVVDNQPAGSIGKEASVAFLAEILAADTKMTKLTVPAEAEQP